MTKNNEVWKDIQGYEGLYQVSNLGKINSLEKIVRGPRGTTRTVKQRILIPRNNGNGYLYVGLCKNGFSKHSYIHRLVAETFLLASNKLPQINHIDGDKNNNCVDNLEYCTQSYNNKHAYKLKLRTPKGACEPGAPSYNNKRVQKLSCDCSIVFAEYESLRKAAFANNTSQPSITRACQGFPVYVHKNYKYKYVS